MIKRNNNQFLDEISLKFPDLYKSLNFKSEFKKRKEPILVEDRYGELLTLPENLLKGKYPSIISAVNKNLYFTNKAREIHGNKYDYSSIEYINNKSKIKIICPDHGEFWQTPDNHLQGKGCKFCGNVKISESLKYSTNDFINKASIIHNNYYIYTLSNYINYHDKVKIICPIHGEFEQTAREHLSGCGCKKCNRMGYLSFQRSRYHNEWKNIECFLYLIKCFSDDEIFYKIGLTKDINVRFSGKKLNGYKYELISHFKYNLYDICELENKLHNNLSNFSFIPKNKFKGMYECYLCQDNIVNYFNDILSTWKK